MSEPVFLTLAEVLEAHQVQLEEHGGASGIRDMGMLESALGMPQAGFGGQFLHGTLFDMAAAYAYHISENQPFVDGNKRTGLAAALIFLGMNRIWIEDPKGVLYDAMIQVGTRRMTKSQLAETLRALAAKS